MGVDPIEHEDEVGDFSRPVVGDDSVVGEDEKSFWEWVKAQLNRVKDALGVEHKGKDEDADTER